MKYKNVIIIVLLSSFMILSSGFIFYSSDKNGLPKGWFAAGMAPADYQIGVDKEVFYSGKSSGFIKSKSTNPKDFGTLMQMCQAKEYLGKRLRMTAFIKSEKITDRAGMWLRVDGPGNKALSFDNMQQRPIKGTTEWKKYVIVLDVPANSINLAFGILLNGSGQAWIDDISFKVVSSDIPTTNLRKGNKLPANPLHLDFED